jgi:hypothetical protein
MSEHADELLAEARQRLAELEEKQAGDVDWGEKLDLQPGASFRGRYRGETTGTSKDGGEFGLVLLWGPDGEHRFTFVTAALRSELDTVRPDVGDEIVVVRGDDRAFEVNGEPRTMHRYAVAARPSEAALPGDPPVQDPDEGAPF